MTQPTQHAAVAAALLALADGIVTGIIEIPPTEVVLSRHRVSARELLKAADIGRSVINVYDGNEHHGTFVSTTVVIFTKAQSGVHIAYKYFSNDVASPALEQYETHNRECLKAGEGEPCAVANGVDLTSVVLPSILDGEAGSDLPARGEGVRG
jgi:hypothetical protein